MLLLISAIAPVVIFLYIIYYKDTLKEPIHIVLKCFGGGIISIFPIVVLEMLLTEMNPFSGPFGVSLYDAFIVAGYTEELFKLVFLYLIVWKSKEFDQHYDGIIYAVFVSLGFAIVENIMYVFDNGFDVAILRAILSVPLHGLCGVIMGYFFALARFSIYNERQKYLLLSFFIPFIIHGLFDFLLMYMSYATLHMAESAIIVMLLTIFIIFIWRLGLNKIKDHIERDKNNRSN